MIRRKIYSIMSVQNPGADASLLQEDEVKDIAQCMIQPCSGRPQKNNTVRTELYSLFQGNICVRHILFRAVGIHRNFFFPSKVSKNLRTDAVKIPDDIIRASESHQAKQLEEFAQRIAEEHKKVVLIAGPSSSGKTTTAKRLCAEISKCTGMEPLYLGTDDYFVERKDNPIGPDGKPNYEGLDALDMELFNRQMEDLIAGKEVDMPEFDFVSGTKVFGKRITKLKKNQILVIEGIHSLNDVLTENIPRKDKFKIYISPLTQIGIDRHNRISTADARLLRRMVRDNQFRGYNAEYTLDMWPKVRAGESVNIFPYSSSADVVFNSSTVYETCMLKTIAEPLLKAIPETSEQYEEAKRILKFMKYFEKIENTDAVPDNSILREFIGPRK